MRVDFYQLGGASIDSVLAAIAARLQQEQQRLLIVASDEAALARLDRQLWDTGSTFLPHATAGGVDDARQPILLSTTPDAPNLARNIAIAAGAWREAALAFDRAFFLFDEGQLEPARLAWKLLSGRDGVERNYWAQEGGGWAQRG
ncbi:MAG: DNA polymerase III subunit chi [Sphingomonadales bacterium]|nr:DNA polymerase III subunit chi [Sphingomonadales bacterium]